MILDASTAFLLAEWTLRLVMFVVVVLRKRSPSAALVWLVVVAFLPFVGAAAYVASRIHYLQQEYLERSRRLTLEKWAGRGPHRVLGDNVAKLLTPLR